MSLESKLEKSTTEPLGEEQVKKLERHFSQPLEHFTADELTNEALRLLGEAMRENDEEQQEEKWLALWWFYRKAEQEGIINKELPGEEQALLSVHKHVNGHDVDDFVRNDVKNWYETHANQKPHSQGWNEINWDQLP